ncbi:hypothetical protein C8N40_111213 [Pontibacter mucosus]|uniref:YceI-like domain-containing protein n=1 Tax=Pontibacter mucosus TaxID=1649266 RepID=A0A2T5YDC7_9BACT|nr:hypothetical protein [Pontibacter mucosus]PTX14547.1 hypothetical protein C8N40_111213 [Pontibacter mucosus]
MTIKLRLLYLLLLPLFLFGLVANAQRNRSPYTGSNRILLTLDGSDARYEFMSDQVLVRYNREMQQLECILPVETLLPLQDSIPRNMAYEVLYGARYPQLYITMAAPVQQINAGNLSPETVSSKVEVRLQNTTRNLQVPVTFSPESTSLYFTATLDLQMEDFQASLPVAYLPLLTGRFTITIDRARWVELTSR